MRVPPLHVLNLPSKGKRSVTQLVAHRPHLTLWLAGHSGNHISDPKTGTSKRHSHLVSSVPHWEQEAGQGPRAAVAKDRCHGAARLEPWT